MVVWGKKEKQLFLLCSHHAGGEEGMMFHASRRRDFPAPGILRAPPAEKSAAPKCGGTRVGVNEGQRVSNFQEESLLQALSGESCGDSGSASNSP